MNPKVKSIIQFIVFLGIGVFLLFLLYNKLNVAYQEECAFKGIPESDCSLIKRIIEDFRSVNAIWIALICIIFMFSNWLRAIRWKQLLAPLGYHPSTTNALGTVMVAYLSNLALPRIGEVVRAGSLSKYEDIPVSKVFGTVVVDRILDFISLFVVIGLALLLSFTTFQDYFAKNFELPPGKFLMIAGVMAVLGLVGLFVLNRILSAENVSNKFFLKIQQIWKGFKDGFKSVAKVENKPLLVLNSIGIWLMYYLMTYFCFFAFAPTQHLGAVAGLVVFVFGTLGIVLPSPGGIGSYQWLVSQALIIYGIDKFDAFSFSNIMFFAVQIFCNILFGLFFLMYLPYYNEKRKNTN